MSMLTTLPWQLITEVGGVIVQGALAGIITLWLLLERRVALARDWCIVSGLGQAIVLLSKIAFVGWGMGSQALDFTGLSGHSARAMNALPVLAFLLFYHARPGVRLLAVWLMVLSGALVSYSRLMVHAHSLSEVLSGGGFGLLLAAIFMWRVGQAQQFRFNSLLATVSLLGLLLSPHAGPVATQNMLIQLTLKITGHPRPFTRLGWRYDPYYCIEPAPGVSRYCQHYP